MALSYSFEAIGTHWTIDIYEDISLEKETVIREAVNNRIALFDSHYSRFKKDSLITEMSHHSGIFVMPDDAQPMLEFYKQLYTITKGLVTPLIGQVLSDAGYDAGYSLKQKTQLQAPPSWDSVLDYHHPALTVHQPVLLDFGAAGKGYLIDIVAELLETHGIHSYCVDAGGDMIHRGSSALTVGLENPKNTAEAIGIVSLDNKSLCGSAGNRRAWGAMHHIVNPESLDSPKTIAAVWVMADSTMLADGLTTCLFFFSAEILKKMFDFQYLILWQDYSVEKSEGFPSELFVV
jgi:thiamine biosynthesis lipoprotein